MGIIEKTEQYDQNSLIESDSLYILWIFQACIIKTRKTHIFEKLHHWQRVSNHLLYENSLFFQFFSNHPTPASPTIFID